MRGTARDQPHQLKKSSGAKRSRGVSEARTHPLGKTRSLEEIIIGTYRPKH